MENKIRIPVLSHTRRNALSTHSAMLTQGRQINPEAEAPKEVHTQCMFQPNATWPTGTATPALDRQFQNPCGIDRPIGSTVALSPYQKRLDHLNENRALAACIPPDAFERGVPLKECDSSNGFYFNKYTASEHSQLVVEIGIYLSGIPGIESGPNSRPASFGEENKTETESYQNLRGDIKNMVLNGEAGTANNPVTIASDKDGPNPNQVRQDDMPELPRAQCDEEDEEERAELPSGPPYYESATDAANLGPIDDSVKNPNHDGTGISATPGASRASAAKSTLPDAPVKQLPYDWNMQAIFLSCKAADTLYNDCTAYVDKTRKLFPDVFEHESIDETLRDLPQISMRFPGLKDAKTLMPLTRPVPLVRSRVVDITKTTKSTKSSREIVEASLSFAHGRKINFTDPEVADQEAEANGVDSGFALTGNVFARSTWQRFTMSALDARGMLTPAESVRVNDQGLGLRLRVRNARAHAKHEWLKNHPYLEGGSRASLLSFQAQDRAKRSRTGGDEAECDETSDGAKRRATEQTTKAACISDAMDIDASV